MVIALERARVNATDVELKSLALDEELRYKPWITGKQNKITVILFGISTVQGRYLHSSR
jgi:hypothetical protein